MPLDVEKIRKDFPILGTMMNGNPLIYFDSASTSQKPRQVIGAVSKHYKKNNANVHRGIYKISEDKLMPVGRGCSVLRVEGGTKEQQAPNRRVEFYVLD